MGNIIQFPCINSENIGYDISNGNGDAVMDKGLDLIVGFDEGSVESVFIAVNGEGIHTDRKRLAEFLWCAAYMVDSEQRFAEGEYPARNY